MYTTYITYHDWTIHAVYRNITYMIRATTLILQVYVIYTYIHEIRIYTTTLYDYIYIRIRETSTTITVLYDVWRTFGVTEVCAVLVVQGTLLVLRYQCVISGTHTSLELVTCRDWISHKQGIRSCLSNNRRWHRYAAVERTPKDLLCAIPCTTLRRKKNYARPRKKRKS